MRAGKFAMVAGLFAGLFTSLAASLSGGTAFAQEMQPKADQPQQQQEGSGTQNPQAQNPESQPEDAVNAMIGAWEFSNADHDKVCRFTFRTEAASGGRRLDVDKNCPSLFPSTKNISGWALDNYGDLRLLDKQGQAVIELTEVEGGMYDGFAPGEGRYVLQTAAAAPVRSADDVAGDWAVARGAGKPICTVTLVNSPAAGGGLTLRVKAGCDPFITRFNPSAWRMDEGELVLLSARGLSWQFEENDANTWQRVPESADPILLMRQ
jgi:Protease inhibitor Inh